MRLKPMLKGFWRRIDGAAVEALGTTREAPGAEGRVMVATRPLTRPGAPRPASLDFVPWGEFNGFSGGLLRHAKIDPQPELAWVEERGAHLTADEVAALCGGRGTDGQAAEDRAA